MLLTNLQTKKAKEQRCHRSAHSYLSCIHPLQLLLESGISGESEAILHNMGSHHSLARVASRCAYWTSQLDKMEHMDYVDWFYAGYTDLSSGKLCHY